LADRDIRENVALKATGSAPTGKDGGLNEAIENGQFDRGFESEPAGSG